MKTISHLRYEKHDFRWYLENELKGKPLPPLAMIEVTNAAGEIINPHIEKYMNQEVKHFARRVMKHKPWYYSWKNWNEKINIFYLHNEW